MQCVEPKIGDTVSDEDAAQRALNQAQTDYASASGDANCATAAKALNDEKYKAYPGDLAQLKDQNSVASVLLNECRLRSGLNDGQHEWYAQRALAWQILAADIDGAKIQDPAVTKGKIAAPPFQLPADVVSKLTSPVGPISEEPSAPTTQIRIAGSPHAGDTTVTLTFDPIPQTVPEISLWQLNAPVNYLSGSSGSNDKCGRGHGTPLHIANSANAKSPLSAVQPTVGANGTASIALASPLVADTYICAASDPIRVWNRLLDWLRILLISDDCACTSQPVF